MTATGFDRKANRALIEQVTADMFLCMSKWRDGGSAPDLPLFTVALIACEVLLKAYGRNRTGELMEEAFNAAIDGAIADGWVDADAATSRVN